MKKTNTFLISISFLIICFAASCNQQHKKDEGTTFSQSAIENSNTPKALSPEELFDRLLTSFGDDWMEREADPTLYPEYYGGAFINNNGMFVVTVTGNREEHKRRLTEILGTDNFNVETVQYSYRQMMRVMDSIDAFLMDSSIPEDHPLVSRFAGAYPDVMENRVKVLLTKVDDATIRIFQKDVVNSPLIIFEQGELPGLM
ncbi:MAG: hypothetical protein VB074_16295 [Proteiniphilum sp.]|jgi:hypothetical protein|uniref:hypothetical protein n=1 Tax=Proteiniphilum sp. TaxID=1926877 RepID=UPI002B2082C6|nr:hypothetical protein [Proteiniphilum sp.]MEA5129737.1 hypothetical protein [Proteiniphilum sp.]